MAFKDAEHINAGTETVHDGDPTIGRLCTLGSSWVIDLISDGHYDKQTFGWIATSIESFLEANDALGEPNESITTKGNQ